MKPLIICSVHALCDISRFERTAFNRACAMQGIPAILTTQDFARVLATTSALGILTRLPGSLQQRRALVESYLDLLNEEIWSASPLAYQSVLSELPGHGHNARPMGFVSDYPMPFTNLVRAAALGINATRLGVMTPLPDPLTPQTVAAGLAASAASLDVDHRDVDVLVAHQRDFVAAQSIGMQPRFVPEIRPFAQLRSARRSQAGHLSADQNLSGGRVRLPDAIPA